MIDKINPSKNVLRSISELISKNVPKQEIFLKVKLNHPELNDDVIARGIASFIPEDVKNKYRIHSYLLSLIVIINAIFSLLVPNPSRTDSQFILSWGVKVIFIIIVIFFINGFLRFKLFYYSTAVSLYSLYLLMVIYNFIVYPISAIFLIVQIGIVLTFLFLYLLRKQIFPNIGFWGNVIKENGSYKF